MGSLGTGGERYTLCPSFEVSEKKLIEHSSNVGTDFKQLCKSRSNEVCGMSEAYEKYGGRGQSQLSNADRLTVAALLLPSYF